MAESWTRKTTHTGDGVGYYEFDQRFEHPGANLGERDAPCFLICIERDAPCFLICMCGCGNGERDVEVQAKSKQAMKQVLGIKNEAARMKVTPPLAVRHAVESERQRY